jgi:hypothetical protein
LRVCRRIGHTEGGSGRTVGIVEAILSGGAEVDGGKCDLMMPIAYVAHLQAKISGVCVGSSGCGDQDLPAGPS